MKISCPAGPLCRLVDSHAKVWALQTATEVILVPFEPSPGSSQELSADLCLISPSRLAKWASKGQLQAIPSQYLSSDGSYNWLDLLSLYRNKLLLWDRQVYGLPLNGDASLCFFREDLFRDGANQSAFQGQFSRRLAAPTTWEEFAEIAEFFNGKPRPAISRPVSSLPSLSDTEDGIDREFFTIAATMARRAVREDDRNQPADEELFSFHYDLKTGQNRIANPGFTEALRMMLRLQACRPKAPAENPPEEFRKGQAVLCIAPAEWVGRFQEDGSLVKGRFEICRVPGSRKIFDYETGQAQESPEPNFVPYQGVGGCLGVVPQAAKNPEAAFAFLAELTGPKISAEIFLNPIVGCGPTRREHFGLLTRANAFELGAARTNSLAEVLRRSLYPPPINPVVRLRTPDEQEHQRILGEELRLALQEKNRDPQKVMSSIAQRWKELDERKPLNERLIHYRLSLGLPGGG